MPVLPPTIPVTAVVRNRLPAGRRAQIVRVDFRGQAFEHAAGQAVLVTCAGAARKRTFSIASPPAAARRYGWIELLVGTDGDRADDGSWTPGALLNVEGPFGTFTFPRNANERQFVFVAGGTGIAPLRSMLPQAIAVRGGAVAVLYSARDHDGFAYEDELRDLAADGRIQLHQTITRGRPAPDWRGSTGRLGPDVLQPFLAEPSTLWFVCGPAGLVDAVRQHLRDLGVAPQRVRTEHRAPAAAPACDAAVAPAEALIARG
jgi:ferredoxin-NADP reductase